MRTFEHINLIKLDFDLQSETTDGKRVYITPEGNRYKSITTVLGSESKSGIEEWVKRVGEEEANRVKKRAADRGTKLHKLCEDYINNEVTPIKLTQIMPDLKENFVKIKTHIDEHVGRVYAQEQALYSDRLRIAGRVDLICEWKGKLSIVDFKTSTKIKQEQWIENYFLQCTAYALMFHERTGMWIDDIVVLISTEEGEAQVFEKQIHPYVKGLMTMIDKYA
jgi:genome maintenance exonuclease 1